MEQGGSPRESPKQPRNISQISQPLSEGIVPKGMGLRYPLNLPRWKMQSIETNKTPDYIRFCPQRRKVLYRRKLSMLRQDEARRRAETKPPAEDTIKALEELYERG